MNEQNGGDVSLNEIYKLVKENNRMLKKMRRDAFVGGILKFVWWILMFFVLPYVIYVIYLQPYLTSLQSAYSDFQTTAGKVDSATQQLEDLKNKFPNWQEILNLGGSQN